MHKVLKSLVVVFMCFISLAQLAAAVFEESVSVAGASFSVGVDNNGGGTPTGNTALKVYLNNSGLPQGSNLVDSVSGPQFGNITSEWVDEFAVKIYNKGTSTLDLLASAVYVSDPNTLRDDIYVEIFEWNDSNNNGSPDTGELGSSKGRDTILRLKNDTFGLGQINSSETKGFVLRFDGSGLSDANIGQSATYDFTFNGIESIGQ